MEHRSKNGRFVLAVTVLLLIYLSAASGQQTPANSVAGQPPASSNNQKAAQEEGSGPGEVMIEGRGPIVTVYETIGSLTPEERARAIEARIVAAAREGGAANEPAQLSAHAGWVEIHVGKQPIMAVTDADAEMAGIPRQQLAARYAENITREIQTYRQEHNWRVLIRGALKTIFATILLVSVLWFIRRLRLVFRLQLDKQIRRSTGLEQKPAWHVLVTYAGSIILALGALVRWTIILALVQTYLTVALGFFPYTRAISLTVTNWVLSQLGSLAKATLDYLPNLVVVAAIALAAWYAFRLLRFIFSEIRKGELKIHGFYPDWAEPTEKLIRLLVLALATIVAFPYLPGAKSPAFQGISIFVGVLLSLGSSSAVANAIAGIILTYMRSFLVGDWVQIGDTIGEVVEKNLLVTRVLTPKAEIITIPNATVMSGTVKNYSVEANKSGVIFYTTVTIGYDAPWRTVHQLLIKAALATEHIVPKPQPFVLQSKLDDFYVCYELNAYTTVPSEMQTIYSVLHQNIQDAFNEAGVEICSPHFSSLRDGNVIAIPQQYVAPDYQPPSFRVCTTETSDVSLVASNQSAPSRRAG